MFGVLELAVNFRQFVNLLRYWLKFQEIGKRLNIPILFLHRMCRLRRRQSKPPGIPRPAVTHAENMLSEKNLRSAV